MNDTQKILFDLLCEFDDICKENQIEYMLSGGCLLGAVRNRGFLPWDDDVDVRIKRSEFEKLDAVLSKQDRKDRAWVTDQNTPGYNNPIARYFNLDTTLIYPYSLTINIPKGHTVEVFILDPIPTEPIQKLEFLQKLWLYSELRNEYATYSNIALPADVTDEDLYYHYKERIKREGIGTVSDELYASFACFPEEKAEEWCGRASGAFYIFDDETINGTTAMAFEGREFPVAKKYLHHLKCSYGYNWNIVPKDQDIQTHRSVQSCEISFSEKSREVEQIVIENDYDATQKLLKKKRVERVFARKKLQKCEIQKTLLRLNEIIKLLEAEKDSWDYRDFDNLKYRDAFKEIRSALVSKKFKQFNISVPIRDDILAVILGSLLTSDRIDDVLNITSRYSESTTAKKFRAMSELIFDCKLYKYYDSVEVCESIIEELNDYRDIYKIDEQPEIKRIILWIRKREDAVGRKLLNDLTKDAFYIRDPESLKYIADIYDQTGKKEKAERIYSYVTDKTRNGMLIQNLRDEGHYYDNGNKTQPFLWAKMRTRMRRKVSVLQSSAGNKITDRIDHERLLYESKEIDKEMEGYRKELEDMTQDIDNLIERQNNTLERIREVFR